MIDSKLLENIGALEKGVIIPTCDVKTELDRMQPEEARIAKRRWRKLKRRARRRMKSMGVKDDQITKKAMIFKIRSVLREVGEEKLGV